MISRFLSSLQCSILSCPRPFLFVLIHCVSPHFVLRQDSFHTVSSTYFSPCIQTSCSPLFFSLCVNDTLQVRAQTELQSRLCCFASRCHSRCLATCRHLVPVSSPLLSRHLPLCLGTLVLETTRLSLCDLILPLLSATSVMPSLSTSSVPSLRQTIVIYGMTMTKRAQNLGRWPDQISDTPTITATAITITSRLKKKSTISYG